MLRVAPFTYARVGATASGRPAGDDWLERSALGGSKRSHDPSIAVM